MHKSFNSTILVVALIGLIGTQAYSKTDELDAFITAAIEEGHHAGLSACIIKDGGIVWAKGYGWADRENTIPMTPDIVQNIGSVSKAITATAVMQLWEKRLFKLDDDVNNYLPFAVRNPRFPDVPITFRQLLTHRSSIKDGAAYDASYRTGDPKISLADWCREYLTPEGRFYDADDNFHTWKPGETGEIPAQPRAYTNVGFGLLGYLVELIAAEDFAEYTKNHIFAPLEMTETSWYIRDIDLKKQAVPYIYVPADQTENAFIMEMNNTLGLHKDKPLEEGFLPLDFYSFPNISDGLVRTSVNQLSRFLLMYIGGGEYRGAQVLKKSTVDTMLSSDHFSRGLCWEQSRNKQRWYHSGGDPGIRTMALFDPARRWGLIVFSTGSGGGMEKVLTRLIAEAEQY